MKKWYNEINIGGYMKFEKEISRWKFSSDN